jgi:hypothetical protein
MSASRYPLMFSPLDLGFKVLAWKDGPGRVIFEVRVGERTVVSHAWFEYA